jgi:hypothetical protein
MPAEFQNSYSPFMLRVLVNVDYDNDVVTFYGQYGQSYPFTMESFVWTADIIGAKE